MIEVQNITKQYGAVEAVKDVSFSVGQDQVLGFLGPNGAGKTTIMKVLTGSLSHAGDGPHRRRLRAGRSGFGEEAHRLFAGKRAHLRRPHG